MRSASEEPVPLHEEFIYCCGAATHVLKCGPWKDLSKDESKNLPRLLFMIIPGNPGLAGYYRTFIQALYCGLNQQYPVWVVSHAGHCKPPSGMEMIEDTDIKELEDVFGLNGQVEHKLNFLKKNVSKDIKLVLIAHSIGCYITLEMMKRASELQVLRSVLLFPTIERMAQSPQGKLMTPLLCKLRYVLYMPVYLLSFLPEGVKASLVRFALRGMKTCDESSITTSVNLFSVDCIELRQEPRCGDAKLLQTLSILATEHHLQQSLLCHSCRIREQTLSMTKNLGHKRNVITTAICKDM
ncbi:lipid droplet-associated hydrolase isoform X2 [Rissa tridactyla]|uniref:lipid droplet-associated hydrolase isoform X2 n=1 Tax=Rissa tridactyla TaxID=75485 RepID=UPI0023BABE36|nr:lipid droplet-associated hydrolase isoform X2 [Rissa tridactyla]